MYEMDKMCEIIADEIEKIADKGLTTSNLDTAYKLIDMYKDIKTIEGMEAYTDGDDNGDEYGRYMATKRNYRHSRSTNDKARVMDALTAYMDDMTDKLEGMLMDSETQEERDAIREYINKIKSM